MILKKNGNDFFFFNVNDISNAIISRSKQNYFCQKVFRGVFSRAGACN